MKPGGGDIHDETLERKRQKAQVARQRHLEDLASLQNGENVMPLGGGPIVPEFPQPTTDKAGNHQRIEPRAAPLGKVPNQGRKAELVIDWIKQKHKANPNESEQVSGNMLWRGQRN